MGTTNLKTTIDTHKKRKSNPNKTLKMIIRPQETEEKEKTYNNKPKTIKRMVIGTYISIITLNVNGLNAPT